MEGEPGVSRERLQEREGPLSLTEEDPRREMDMSRVGACAPG